MMIGVFGFVCTSYNKHDLFYLGEELTEKTLVLSFKPEHLFSTFILIATTSLSQAQSVAV